MDLEVTKLTYKHKLNNKFCLGPLDVFGQNYLKVHGANGAGKTTFLKCLAGVYKPSAGSIKLAGKDISQVVWVGAESAIYWDSLTAREYILLQAKLYGVSRDEASRHLQSFKFQYLEQNIFSLSTGQKKIISVVASIITQCPFVILDEPDSNLDSANRAFLYNLILSESRLNKQFFLFSSHISTSDFAEENIYELNKGGHSC